MHQRGCHNSLLIKKQVPVMHNHSSNPYMFTQRNNLINKTNVIIFSKSSGINTWKMSTSYYNKQREINESD